ncbi:hypothetical protein ACFC14_13605 [Microbacterium sp. NPDC055988]|uniref:hypothetical protein n=1 Tax=Microbacterium sp. NPDC055988 TaxID=3345671 RepID=UPI0035DD6809
MVDTLSEHQLEKVKAGLEAFLFGRGDISQPQEKDAGFTSALSEVLHSSTQIQSIPPEFVLPIVRYAYDCAMKRGGRNPTTDDNLKVLTHLLGLGDYDDSTLVPILRGLRPFEDGDPVGFDSAKVAFYEAAGVRPKRDETFTSLMRRSGGVRTLLAVLSTGTAANRVALKPGSPGRRRLLSTFWPIFKEVLASPVALQSALTDDTYAPVTVESGSRLAPRANVNPAMVRGGWGPARDSVSSLSRPARVALNSIFNNPRYGDERNFARVRPVDDIDADYVSYLTVTPGVRYQALVYFGNSAHIDSGLSTVDARVRVQAPATFEGSGRVTTFFSAANATPSTVWDSFVIGLPSPTAIAAIRYLPDSAFVHVGGLLLAVEEDLYRSDGALVGHDALDGVLAPARSDLQFLTFEFRIDRPDFILTCKMRKLGSETWSPEHLDVRPGDVIEVVVKYKNTGTTVQNDVVLRVPHLPDALIYTVGSTRVANSASAWKYQQTTSNLDSPLNVGNYAPGAGVYAKFEMTVRDGVMLGAGENQWLVLNPLATVETNNGTKGAQATLILIR